MVSTRISSICEYIQYANHHPQIYDEILPSGKISLVLSINASDGCRFIATFHEHEHSLAHIESTSMFSCIDIIYSNAVLPSILGVLPTARIGWRKRKDDNNSGVIFPFLLGNTRKSIFLF